MGIHSGEIEVTVIEELFSQELGEGSISNVFQTGANRSLLEKEWLKRCLEEKIYLIILLSLQKG